MKQANPTLTAVLQLMTLVVVLAAVVVLAVTHALHSQAVAALIGGIVAHSGIIAYNGATKATPNGGGVEHLADAAAEATSQAITAHTHHGAPETPPDYSA